MPDPITTATAAMADAHDALREKRLDLMDRHCLDIEEAMERAGFSQSAIDLVITLANDDAAMCAAVRERDRLREAVEGALGRLEGSPPAGYGALEDVEQMLRAALATRESADA